MGHTMQIGDDLDRPAEEERLARSAADGDGGAFATLYDRYERAIFNYCRRLCGSGEDAADATQEAFVGVLQRLPELDEDRELNFSAYLYTAARNASYDAIGRRKRAEPVDQVPEPPSVGADGLTVGALDEDPERSALLASFQEDVRTASARLPERHREVLTLRELDELSYDDIAEIMEMNRNSVAQLISRARIKLRDELRGSALAAIAVSSPECERALPLISMRQDGQLSDAEDRAWLEAHVGACDTCRVSVEAIEEAGVSYRVWAPVLPPAGLRQATIERAGELVGEDWSEVARTRTGAEPDEEDAYRHELVGEQRIHPQRALRHSAAFPIVDPHGGGEEGHEDREAGAAEWEAAPDVLDEEERRQRRAALIGGIVLLLVLIGAVAFVLGGGSEPERSGGGVKKPASAPTAGAGARGAVAAPPAAADSAKPARRKRRKTESEGAVVPGPGSGAGGGGIGTSSTPGSPSEPSRQSPDDRTPSTPNKPDPVDPAPTNTTPAPTTPDPTPPPVTPPSVPTPDPTPPQTPTPDPGASTPPSSVPGGP